MAETFYIGLACIEVGVMSWSWRVNGQIFSECRERGGGVFPSFGFRAERSAEHVVEVCRATRPRRAPCSFDISDYYTAYQDLSRPSLRHVQDST